MDALHVFREMDDLKAGRFGAERQANGKSRRYVDTINGADSIISGKARRKSLHTHWIGHMNI